VEIGKEERFIEHSEKASFVGATGTDLHVFVARDRIGTRIGRLFLYICDKILELFKSLH
jgi:hypothetical protein